MTRITLIAYVLLSFLIVSCTTWAQHQSEVVQVVLLAGQSNMAGAGNFNEIDDATKARLERIEPRVRISVSGNSLEPLSYKISKHHKEKYGFAETFGPEIFMGLSLAETNPTAEYLFAKTAQGGTALYGAWNPEWSAEKAAAVENTEHKRTTRYFDLHIAHVRENLERLRGEGRSYKIIGMAWMQGENDAAREVSALTYEANLRKLIDAYRAEFNEPKMPFVIGQINSTYGRFDAGPAMVRDAMAQVADTDPFAELIETSTNPSWSDYPKHSDNVHYNTEGQLRLGKAFANALLMHEEKP